MNVYEVRFIKSYRGDQEDDLVLEVEANSFDEAEKAARDEAEKRSIWLATYVAQSVEVKHFGSRL